jgi:hypothetical protein
MQRAAAVGAATAIAIATVRRQIVERRNRTAHVRRQQHTPIPAAQLDQRGIVQGAAHRVVTSRCEGRGAQYANRW